MAEESAHLIVQALFVPFGVLAAQAGSLHFRDDVPSLPTSMELFD
jgi:hypothetical protein